MRKNKPDTFAEFMQWASCFNYISYCRSDKSINLYEYHELCYQRYLECFNEVLSNLKNSKRTNSGRRK